MKLISDSSCSNRTFLNKSVLVLLETHKTSEQKIYANILQ